MHRPQIKHALAWCLAGISFVLKVQTFQAAAASIANSTISRELSAGTAFAGLRTSTMKPTDDAKAPGMAGITTAHDSCSLMKPRHDLHIVVDASLGEWMHDAKPHNMLEKL